MSATYGDSQKCDITLAQGENFPVEILALFDNSKDKTSKKIPIQKTLKKTNKHS